MTDNNINKFIPTKQFKPEPYIPKTYDVAYLPELGYEDVSKQKGYGPCHSCGNTDLKFKLEIHLENCAGWYKRRSSS